ncbi:hypothetical protein P7K49_026607 [Saguinus oedipus]|uniref:Uncharacterized protein n=1 Tax=Saguinus oedipus TaxID=9490 RepID=A0ABQ9UDX4_SAGOE|nr:hypothetical protein P7K49_026607 [Saguinus oedipus]
MGGVAEPPSLAGWWVGIKGRQWGQRVLGWVQLQPRQLASAAHKSPTPQPPSPPSPDELPASVKQAYRAFAAVPTPHPPEDTPAQVCGGSTPPYYVWVGWVPRGLSAPEECQPNLRAHSPQPPTPVASPEQLSFRERQKYFELEVRMPQAEGPPKRVSLVGADDLRKMQEEEARKLQQKRAQMREVEEAGAGARLALDAETLGEEEQEDEEPPWASPSPTAGQSPVSPPPPGGSAPVRTAKAERRHQERLRVQSPELPAPERALSPAERRALEAEKRALWRAAR